MSLMRTSRAGDEPLNLSMENIIVVDNLPLVGPEKVRPRSSLSRACTPLDYSTARRRVEGARGRGWGALRRAWLGCRGTLSWTIRNRMPRELWHPRQYYLCAGGSDGAARAGQEPNTPFSGETGGAAPGCGARSPLPAGSAGGKAHRAPRQDLLQDWHARHRPGSATTARPLAPRRTHVAEERERTPHARRAGRLTTHRSRRVVHRTTTGCTCRWTTSSPRALPSSSSTTRTWPTPPRSSARPPTRAARTRARPPARGRGADAQGGGQDERAQARPQSHLRRHALQRDAAHPRSPQ